MLIPVINLIDCKTKEAIAAYLFVPYMASKNTSKDDMTVFEYLKMNQLGCYKSDSRFEGYLTLWLRDFKTEIQMQSMKALGAGCIWAYK